MLSLKFIRENSDLVKKNTQKRGKDSALVDELLKVDEDWRRVKKDIDTIRQARNTVSENINKAKKEGADASKFIAEAKEIPAKLKTAEAELEQVERHLIKTQKQIPNILHEEVPEGKDESENVTRKEWGEKTKISNPINHAQLAEKLGVADFESGARVAGNGFYYLQGDLALLNQALVSFAIDFMNKKGYNYVETPLMVRRQVIDGVMSFAEMEDMIYKIADEDLYLIGTSEHSLIGKYTGGTLKKEDLPLKLASYSMCFRKEIGSHGVDEKGLWRTHQFNKVEQVVICTAEQSWKLFDELLANSEELMQSLELPYRVNEMCTGDLGDLKARQMDIEAWLPRKNNYGEVGSCSNLTSAQATRLGIKHVDKHGHREFCHTLNNTVLATSRIMVAILENNQEEDGSVKIPKVLQSYLGGKEKIKKI
ncbi:serine--tRNA ligase [Candidatus Woesearchaeota archaeon]|nr:serine--tRNA ligase [Candidatus Woesearchaeota archaeon]